MKVRDFLMRMTTPCLALLIFSVLFDPTDKIFHMKKVCFILTVALLFTCKQLRKANKYNFYELSIFFGFMFFGSVAFAFGSFNVNNIAMDNSGFAFAIFTTFIFSALVLFFPDKFFFPKVVNIFITFSVLLAIFVVIIWLMFAFLPANIYKITFINYLNYESASAMITSRYFGPYLIDMIYYKSIVLLFIAIPFLHEKLMITKNKLWLVLIVTSVFSIYLSGTRTNIILVTLFLFLILIDLSGKSIKVFLLGISSVLIPVFIYWVYITLTENQDQSFNIKALDFNAYVELITGSHIYILMGDGFGSLFYSPARGRLVTHSELMYLDLVRWYGITLFSLFMAFLLFPLIVFLKARAYVFGGGYVCYLLVMGTNPLFISSTGMLAMVLCFSKAGILLKNKR